MPNYVERVFVYIIYTSIYIQYIYVMMVLCLFILQVGIVGVGAVPLLLGRVLNLSHHLSRGYRADADAGISEVRTELPRLLFLFSLQPAAEPGIDVTIRAVQTVRAKFPGTSRWLLALPPRVAL